MGIFSKLFNREMKDTTVEPVSYSNEKFHMVVEDVFTVVGKGTVVTGIIDSGELRVGETVFLNGSRNLEVLEIEQFRSKPEYVKKSDACGLLLKDISRDEIHKGDTLSK